MTSAGDDDRDDDPQLRQLRAVWVSMRDEEPSDRGLAALMAAAREKATELEHPAQPSWWQLVLASLRRPPVLALATITVLLGGALVLTQRREELKADATASSERSADTAVRALGPGELDPTSAGPAAGGFQGDGLRTAGAAGAGSAATFSGSTSAEPENAQPAVAVARPAVAQVVTEKAPSRDPRSTPKLKAPAAGSPPPAAGSPPPAAGSPPPAAGGPPPAAGTLAATSEGAAPAPVGANEVGPRGGKGGGSPALAIAQDEAPAYADDAGDAVASSPVVASKPKPKKPVARTAPPSIEGEDRQTTRAPVAKDADKVPPTLEQLVKQCETAAVRGDCAAVRALAQRIWNSSPAVYKSRIAPHAAIKRCLPSTADNAME